LNALRRHEMIMETLLAQQEATVQQLSEKLQVTGKTIREDLAKLEEKGLLVRVHGGARLAHGDQFGLLSNATPLVKHVREKEEIAQAAMGLIRSGDIIALDNGSTTLEIARQLPNEPLTVVTNDLHIIAELTRKEQIRLVVPGGTRMRNMLVGAEGTAFVRSLNIQKAFVSATGVHLQQGLTVYTGELIDYKRALIEVSETVYAVADHHKFGQSALRTFAELREVSRILTDSGLPDETAEAFRQAGIDLYRGR